VYSRVLLSGGQATRQLTSGASIMHSMIEMTMLIAGCWQNAVCCLGMQMMQMSYPLAKTCNSNILIVPTSKQFLLSHSCSLLKQSSQIPPHAKPSVENYNCKTTLQGGNKSARISITPSKFASNPISSHIKGDACPIMPPNKMRKVGIVSTLSPGDNVAVSLGGRGPYVDIVEYSSALSSSSPRFSFGRSVFGDLEI